MKDNNITVTAAGQATQYNLSININNISGVKPTRFSSSFGVEIFHGNQVATLYRDDMKEVLKVYFKVLHCIQKVNKSKYKDFLVIYNNEPYLLSELNIIDN